jgi:hypothetical protein
VLADAPADLRNDALRIAVRAERGMRLRLDWMGRSTDSDPTRFLRPFLDAITACALRAEATIEMHFEELEYFNSSTITALIHLLRSTREQHVALDISFRGDARWQGATFEALRAFERLDDQLRIHPASRERAI